MNTRLLLGFLSFVLIASGSAAEQGTKAKPPAAEPERFELKARVTGYVAKVHVKPGADVKEGDLLFEIDPRPYQAQLDQASARCELAEARLMLAKAQLTRAQVLLKTNAISQEEFDKSRADLASAEASLKSTIASRDLAKLNLNFTRVTAPFAGKIDRALVAEGILVKADDTVLASCQRIAAPPQKQPAETPASAKLKELMKERVVVLTKAAAIVAAQHQQGIVDIDKVVQAQRAVIDAHLEAAESQAQRIDLLRDNVKLAELLHKITKGSFDVGKVSQAEMLQARAFVLKAQIRLLREEEKAKGAK